MDSKTTTEELSPPAEPPEERPPLGAWWRMYALVIGVLVLDVVLFYLFTEAFK